MKKQFKINTVLALIIVALGIVAGVVLVNRSLIFTPRASSQSLPELVKITNVSDSSFTVSWVTQSSVKGFLNFGENSQQLDLTAFDERDAQGNAKDYLPHYVSAKNLKTNTKYYFKINSSGKNFDNGGKPYEITTASTINLPLPPADTAYGMILNQEGNPAKGAIVYVSLANTTPLSSLVNDDGSWMVPLSMARTLSLNSYSTYDRQIQLEEIFVQAGSLGTVSAITVTKNDGPVPTLTLGQTYDFTQDIAENNQFITPTGGPTSTPSAGTGSKFSLEPPGASLSARLTIINPAVDGEKINTTKPEIKGTAPASELLEINIQSDNIYAGQVMVDKDGNWQWTPPADLAPGEHTVTVIYKDKDGLMQKVIRNFIVLATGETDLPAFTATPSATITLAPTQRIIATPTPLPAQPKTGNLTLTFIFLIIGLALIILGIYQFKTN